MFDLLRKEKIENIGTAFIYGHNTGLKLICIENDDNNRVFTIGFNTLPDNDKGIPHIVEHCVLCGSKNYRVKDPFNILDKGSIHTYLNAMTYSDKTLYPVASTNEADFKTLMKVYLDSVFNPLMYENEGIFRQEGWNSDGKEFNGIVLNEMEGVYSDPDTVLSNAIDRNMYENSGYAYDSGGKPENITDLSYEEFLDFHREHYHPSNAVIYLYGNIDINEYLKIIDSEFLSDFKYREAKKLQVPQCKERGELEIHHKSGKNILTAAFNTGTSNDDVKGTLLGILSTLWCYTEGGNIKEAILKAGLGDKVECSFDDSGMSSIMEITVENSNEKDTKKFREVLNNTFKEMAEKGVDEYKLNGVINSVKFFFKEEDFGYKPKGLFFGLLIVNSFLKGRDSFDCVRINDIFNAIEKVDIKKLVKEYFVDKGLYGILIADNNAKENEKPVPPANNSSLISYQQQEDSPYEIEKLMTTKVSDISKKGERIKYETMNENVFVPLESSDICYIDFYFNVSDVDEKAVLSAYRAVADIYDEKLSNDIDYYLGGFNIEVTTLQRKNEYKPVIVFKIKCLKENVNKAVELFERLITQTFEDTKRIERLILEARQNLRLSYIDNGSIKAVTEALACVNGAGFWSAESRGINYFKYTKSDPEKIKSDINALKSVFKRGNAFYALAGAKEDKERLSDLSEKALSCLDKGGEQSVISSLPKSSNIGIITKGNVCFNAIAFPLDCDSGVARVAQQIISREYIWDKIRLEGGAYGGSSVFGRHYGYMYSYRDPNLERSFEVFKNAGKYLTEKNYSQSDIDRFIIGTINEIDRPEKKHRLTGIAVRKAFINEGNETVIRRREEILSATPKDIKSYGEIIMSAPIKGMCSVGRKDKISGSQIFDELYKID